MPTISVGSIDQVVFARTHGVRMSGVLEYNGQLYGISESKSGPYASDYAYECPGWASCVLPPSQTADGRALTTAMRSGPASRPIELQGKELQQFMRSGADFSKAVFTKIDFADTDLSGLDLRGTQFVGCTFNGVKFNKAKLQGTRFHGCDIEATAFNGAQAAQGSQRKNPVRTEFRDCRLADSSFCEHADFSGALFVNCIGISSGWETAILHRAVFADCYLSCANFNSASLREATFFNLNRVTPEGLGTPYDGRTNPDYKNWLPVFTNNADLTDARFLNCQLSGWPLDSHGLMRTLMIRTNVDRCTFGDPTAAHNRIYADRATKNSWGGRPFQNADPAWEAPDALRNPRLMGDLLQILND